MASGSLRVAMIHDVFHDACGPARLRQRLAEARAAGAELAVLPELPLDPWIPATREHRDDDAEMPSGRRTVPVGVYLFRVLASHSRAPLSCSYAFDIFRQMRSLGPAAA